MHLFEAHVHPTLRRCAPATWAEIPIIPITTFPFLSVQVFGPDPASTWGFTHSQLRSSFSHPVALRRPRPGLSRSACRRPPAASLNNSTGSPATPGNSHKRPLQHCKRQMLRLQAGGLSCAFFKIDVQGSYGNPAMETTHLVATRLSWASRF